MGGGTDFFLSLSFNTDVLGQSPGRIEQRNLKPHIIVFGGLRNSLS